VVQADNSAEQLYVTLNGNATVTHEDPSASQIAVWTPWNIPLQTFTDLGVDTSNGSKITLGLGDKANPTPGGSGTMYFDDIGVH